MRRATAAFCAGLASLLLAAAVSCAVPPPQTPQPADKAVTPAAREREPAPTEERQASPRQAALGPRPGQPAQSGQPGFGVPGVPAKPTLKAESIESTYPAATGGTAGFFKTGQSADIALSAVDFNNSGGALLFNHQSGIATDGTHLLLADRNNNRVLIWNTLPAGNVPPDLVLGQPDFTSNSSGGGLNQMNWPVSLSTDGQRLVVADTFNDRILVWSSFPTASGTPADFALQGARPGDPVGGASVAATSPEPLSERKAHFVWPWGVWTDGRRLVVSSTQTSAVLIWNSFPAHSGQAADFVVTAEGKMATPRTITSDGTALIVGDQDAGGGPGTEGPTGGNFVWKSFPTRDEQPPDYFMTDPVQQIGGWMQGTFTPDGGLALLGDSGLHLWKNVPQSAAEKSALSVTGFRFDGGDGSAIAAADGRLYVSAANGNRVLVYNGMPTRPDQGPDFAIGSSDVDTNTLETSFVIGNPMPASSGRSLFVASDVDRKMYVWKQLPDRSGAKPDYVYTLPDSPRAIALHGEKLALVGLNGLTLWNELPLNGELPDLMPARRLGSLQLQRPAGVAIDDRYFYISDAETGKVYVWEGVPGATTGPKFTVEVGRGAGRISSDGKHLVAVVEGASDPGETVAAYRVSDIAAGAKPIPVGDRRLFDLPPNQVTVARGHLFVPQTHLNRVLVWRRIEDAIAGRAPDVLLGKSDPSDVRPRITRDQLFWPSSVDYDGSYLWVGEFKFSGRLLRFSPSP